jgi:predicted RND superfamily exporter protein
MIAEYVKLYAMQIKIVVFVLLLGLSFFGGYKLKSTFVEAAESKALKAEIKAKEELQKKYDALSERVLAAVGQNDVVHTKTIEKQYKEVEKPVYELCIIPESGILIQNEQIDAFNKQIRGPK